MTVEDAVMELQTSGDTLLLFLNADTGEINLLYEMVGESSTVGGESRYGWVEPQR